ncbi:Adenovirus E3 region protein CR2 [Penicillium coprophilum]|uniref:Adenovirus E3 region protein CR2 n=1 Tax=Penicillium coprophilum TaxID=36646 RepID=UPI00238A19D3|nr:Adenovirus E3 region protein CR2 [Penicillium coprophilum]KAJ5154302.1 Adenovirus E3 region protein CR2 [Penicillium coprophilum]
MLVETESSESLGSLVPRDLNTCTGIKQWYVCTAGNFRGCCSSDPFVNTLVDDRWVHWFVAKRDAENHHYVLHFHFNGVNHRLVNGSVYGDTCTFPDSVLCHFGNISRFEDTPSKTHDFKSFHKLHKPTAIGATGTTAPSPSTSSNTPGAASSNLGAIIGGVVGGVAVLIICAILLFCCCRHKRKYGKREKGSTLVSWYSNGFTRKDRATASKSKGPLSPSDSEANNTSSAVSPFTIDNTRASTILTPDLTLVSSSTSLISHSPLNTPPVPPTKVHSNELFASVPPRQGFTPELQDTGFHRLRAELASHSQSELINVPMEHRQRQQSHIKSRPGPRAWESPALAPMVSPYASPRTGTDNGSHHSHSNSNGGSPARNPAGRVITAEGVVLGANLDRYSNGMEIGESQAQGERGRKAERGETDHVMSFMQYGGRSEDRGLGNGLGITTDGHTSSHQGRRSSASRSRPKPAERSLEYDIAAAEGHADIPPAYQAEEGAPGRDTKSPSGTMGMSLRGV